jgi:RNA polymerase sigma-70 factor (ECF subfamily)
MKQADSPESVGRARIDQAMNRYARGEDAAFADVYRYGAPRVRGFLLQLSRSSALAEDLTQDVFMRVHRARAAFAANAAATPWMLAIARNAFVSYKRREKVRTAHCQPAAGIGDGSEHVASSDVRGDELLLARQTWDALREELNRLPPRQREALVLTRLEGLSAREAAQVVGGTEASVKVRASRAAKALRFALGC